MAAGKGTRMKSDRPKVLHHLAGRSLLQHVIDTCAQLGATRIVVIPGHGADNVEAAVTADNPSQPIVFARQMPQLGTGHAVQQAVPVLPDDDASRVAERVLAREGRLNAVRAAEMQRQGWQSILDRFAAHIRAEHLPHALIVDCSGRADMAERYEGWLAQGIHVVTPSKHAGSGDPDRLAALHAAGAKSGASASQATGLTTSDHILLRGTLPTTSTWPRRKASIKALALVNSYCSWALGIQNDSIRAIVLGMRPVCSE